MVWSEAILSSRVDAVFIPISGRKVADSLKGSRPSNAFCSDSMTKKRG